MTVRFTYVMVLILLTHQYALATVHVLTHPPKFLNANVIPDTRVQIVSIQFVMVFLLMKARFAVGMVPVLDQTIAVVSMDMETTVAESTLVITLALQILQYARPQVFVHLLITVHVILDTMEHIVILLFAITFLVMILQFAVIVLVAAWDLTNVHVTNFTMVYGAKLRNALEFLEMKRQKCAQDMVLVIKSILVFAMLDTLDRNVNIQFVMA